ncbi:ESX secretion-associated protein EspG [Nocardia higoensis]|uniref:ESX secretion-associated protein EspG n=1 Tax=Nocardia higoensis TaxID=228599 RepID=UPI0002D95619|nr:ESX secretion-associated protein EspG [Nocardia higoensis]
MTPRWSFTDLEFVVLWQRLREDPLPHPFMFTSDIPYEDDFQRARVQVAERLRAMPDPALDAALEDVARPDIAIRVRGFDGADPSNPTASIRLLAARRESRGYLLTQLPGRTIDHSAGFTVAEGEAVRLADMVADALPDAPAGDYEPFTLPSGPGSGPADEFEAPTRLWDSYDEPPDARGRKFLSTVPERIGVIEIAQGMSRFGPKGRVVRLLHWRDLPGDGRHVITAGPPVTAAGVDRQRLIAAINAELVTVVRAIRDERV